MQVEIKGMDKLVAKLNKISDADLSKSLEKACMLVENTAKAECPVDTGQLRNSITHEVDKQEGYVGTNVEYAPYVEFGTYKMQAQPFLQPALSANAEKIKIILSEGVKEVVK